MPARAITRPEQLAAAQNAEDMSRRAGWAADGLRLYGQAMDARIGEAITAAEAEMTIEGASTITLEAHDPSRSLLLANKFANQKFDVRIDDEWFRLVGVSKQGDALTLTFEDRAVAWMRQYSNPRKAFRDQSTRAEFILSLVDEVTEGTILVYCPELHKIQPIAGGGGGGGGGGSPDLQGRAATLTGKASTYGDTSYYNDPGDDSFGSQKPASGMSPNVPGVATLDSSRTGGWWVWKAPNGRVAALPQSDVGPSSSTGCVVDINTPACSKFGYGYGSAFPTKQGTWTGWYFGKGESARQSAAAAAGQTAGESRHEARAQAAASDTARQQGIAPAPSGVTVKGQAADREQLRNIATILSVGQSSEYNAPRPVLIAAIMTATVESVIRNTRGGDRDSAGVFQQRPSQGWGTYAQVTDVAYAAGKFFAKAVKNYRANPSQSLNDLCQSVQRSGTPDAFGRWEREATRTVDAFVAADAVPDGGTTATASTTERYAFQRGQGSTRENTWECAGRLCEEVGWRRWMAGGTLFLVAERDIFASRPRMRISETSEGVGSIDFDIVMGRKPLRDQARNASVAEMTVSVRLDAWKAPPGSVVLVEGMGPADGRWLVTTVRWDLFGLAPATVTLKKPIAELPEPAPQTTDAPDTTDGSGGGSAAASGDAASLVAWLKTQVGYREGPGNQNKYGPADSWCGYFVQYGLEKIAKLPISSSMGYVPHIESMISAGAAPFVGPVSASQMQPGDVISWGDHTGFYIGGGRAISGNYGGGSTLVSEHSSTEPGSIKKVGRPRWKS